MYKIEDRVKDYLISLENTPELDLINRAYQFVQYRMSFPDIPTGTFFDSIDEVCEDPDSFTFQFEHYLEKTEFAKMYEVAFNRAEQSDYVPTLLGRACTKGVNLKYVRVVRELARHTHPHAFFVDQVRIFRLPLYLSKQKAGASEEDWLSNCRHQGTDILKKMDEKGVIRLVKKAIPHKTCATYHWIEDLTQEQLAELRADPPQWAKVPVAIEDDDEECPF